MCAMKIKTSEKQRVFVCGDLHGEYGFFIQCLDKLGFNKELDVLVCTGDLVDRGPESYKLLCHFLYDKTCSFFSVRGNHDQFLVEKDYATALYNGAQWILEHEQETLDILGDRIKLKLPVTITIETPFSRYGVVHAEVEYGFTDWDDFIKKPNLQVATWSRDFITYCEHKEYQKQYTISGVENVFHGHTIVPEPFSLGNRVYIDTGASYYGNLTFVELTPNGNIFTTFRKDETRT